MPVIATTVKTQIPIIQQTCAMRYRERTIIGSVSYRNRYWVYRIVSYRLLLYRPIYAHQCRFINCWRMVLHTMIKKRSSSPSPARRARMRACCFMVHDTGESWRGGRRKETVSRRGWYQVTKTAHYLVLATITPHSLHQQEVITTVSCQSL